MLDKLYTVFNTAHPADYRGRSLSVSDLIALDGIGDPGNFGTIARSCRAAGVRELWYSAGTVDPWSDKAVRSGMGAQFGLNVRGFDSLDTLLTSAAEKKKRPALSHKSIGRSQ